MVHDLDALDAGADGRRVSDVPDSGPHSIGNPPEVMGRPRPQVVEHADPVAGRRQGANEIGPNEAGTAGYQDIHGLHLSIVWATLRTASPPAHPRPT